MRYQLAHKLENFCMKLTPSHTEGVPKLSQMVGSENKNPIPSSSQSSCFYSNGHSWGYSNPQPQAGKWVRSLKVFSVIIELTFRLNTFRHLFGTFLGLLTVPNRYYGYPRQFQDSIDLNASLAAAPLLRVAARALAVGDPHLPGTEAKGMSKNEDKNQMATPKLDEEVGKISLSFSVND